MPNQIFVVKVPQLGVNDDKVVITEWYFKDGERVSVGEVICALETSKASFELESEATGYFLHLFDEDAEVMVSESIGLIGTDFEALKLEKDKYSRSKIVSGHAGSSIKATQKAIELANKLNIELEKLGRKSVIREQDIREYFNQNRKLAVKEERKIDFKFEKNPVVIYGAGRGAVTIKECLDCQKDYQVVCFVDDFLKNINELCGLPVYHSSKLPEIVKNGVVNLALGIANGAIRLRIRKETSLLGLSLINVIHPNAYISPTVRIGRGNYIKANAVVETGTLIGDCCIVDNGAIIAHDNVIGDGCHIAPGATLGSGIDTGELSIIGIGASIATGVKIGRAVIISVGSSVVKDVLDYSIIEGVPGKVVGKRKI